MASYDHEFHLSDQYVELTRTCPRQMSQPPQDSTGPTAKAGESAAAEPEHSLRRIEMRIGSIA